MYLTDYHCHTEISPDSHASLTSMAETAIQMGLMELCVTDHCDLIGGHGKPLRAYSWAPSLRQMEKARHAYGKKLKLRLGIELGMGYLNEALCTEILSCRALDFVIGSIHNLSPEQGGLDFYYIKYRDEASCHAVLADYFQSMQRLCESDAYDVLGHIIYPLRYMPFPISLDRHVPVIRAILQRTADRGNGIEINTYRGRTIAEWRPILDIFLDCGGKIVTVGSDAHAPNGLGAGVAAAYHLMKEVGFTHVATYEKRKPILKPI
ncbi:MAG: histidinol-phosphatase HisJ family protein [Oscillospiraceae bacterium]|nr:histidinol-phosphatase HisJ family protein [Oscillospiraceae bacterium]